VWRSETERRVDELGKQSDLMISAVDHLSLPAQQQLLLLELLGLLCPNAASFAFLLLQVDSLPLDLPEGARRILVVSSPWRRHILCAHHPDLTTAYEREKLSTRRDQPTT
jgi:hypothetical protein